MEGGAVKNLVAFYEVHPANQPADRWMELSVDSEEERQEPRGKHRLHPPQKASVQGIAGVHPSIHWVGGRNTPWTGHYTGHTHTHTPFFTKRGCNYHM